MTAAAKIYLYLTDDYSIYLGAEEPEECESLRTVSGRFALQHLHNLPETGKPVRFGPDERSYPELASWLS